MESWTRELADKIAGSDTRLVYFDGDERFQHPMEVASGTVSDLYVKKHVFFSVEPVYAKDFIGKCNLTDYAARNFGR